MCPKHLTESLLLDGNYLFCRRCTKRSNSYKVLNFEPVKVDFTNSFDSGLLRDFGVRRENTRFWSNWRRENLSFLLSRNIKGDHLGLDIGAGDGIFHKFLNLQQIVKIDFTNYPEINVIHDINNSLPFASNSFDYVLMTNVLEHLYDNNIISEAHRLLRKKARLYLTVPFLLDIHQKPYDFHRYTNLWLEKKLSDVGFDIEYISPSEDFGTFETLVEHYFRFKIDSGSMKAKVLWQFQKGINHILKKGVRVDSRLDFTGGYMIEARKTL